MRDHWKAKQRRSDDTDGQAQILKGYRNTENTRNSELQVALQNSQLQTSNYIFKENGWSDAAGHIKIKERVDFFFVHIKRSLLCSIHKTKYVFSYYVGKGKTKSRVIRHGDQITHHSFSRKKGTWAGLIPYIHCLVLFLNYTLVPNLILPLM